MASLARAWALGGLSKQRPASSDLNAQCSGNINRSIWLTYQGLDASLSKQAIAASLTDEKQSPQEHLHPGLFTFHPPGSGAEPPGDFLCSERAPPYPLSPPPRGG